MISSGILLVDNYDSFTYNLVHFVGELGAECDVVRNDEITIAEALARNPTAVILSPGPCDPNKAGICLELVRAMAAKSTPILGVCLGHQTIGQVFGGQVVRAPEPLHGKTSRIRHNGSGVFANLDPDFIATRYHSLTLEPNSLPECLVINATTADGVVMGIRHRNLPIHGVQFHPESIATENGHALLNNFLMLAHAARTKS